MKGDRHLKMRSDQRVSLTFEHAQARRQTPLTFIPWDTNEKEIECLSKVEESNDDRSAANHLSSVSVPYPAAWKFRPSRTSQAPKGQRDGKNHESVRAAYRASEHQASKQSMNRALDDEDARNEAKHLFHALDEEDDEEDMRKHRPPSLAGTRLFLSWCCCCSRAQVPSSHHSPSPLLRCAYNIRRRCFTIAETRTFDRFILFCIICNSVTLAIYDPRGLTKIDESIPIEQLDLIFLIIFLAEMLIKIAAYGLITTKSLREADALEDLQLLDAMQNERTGAGGHTSGAMTLLPRRPRYLDVSWNRLDFVIVISGLTYFLKYLEGLGVTSADLDVLRTLRMLRPLRTINSIPEMRVLIDSLGESATPMANVMLLCSFLFLVFALVGQQLFSGAMTQRCFKSGSHDSSLLGFNTSLPTKTVTIQDDVYFGITSLMPDNYTTPIVGRRCGGAYDCPASWTCRISGIRPVISNKHSTTWGGLALSKYFGNDYANPNFGMTHYDNIGHALLNIFVAVTLEGWVDQMYWLEDSYGAYAPPIFFILLIIFGSLFALNLALAVISDNYSANVQRDIRKREMKSAVKSLVTLRKKRQQESDASAEQARKEFMERLNQAAISAKESDLAIGVGKIGATGRGAGGVSDLFRQSIESLSGSVALDDDDSDGELNALESDDKAKPETSPPMPQENDLKSIHWHMQRARILSAERHAKEDEEAMQHGHKHGIFDLHHGRRGLVYRPHNRLRGLVFNVVNHPYFDAVILLCIFLNTVALAIPHYTVKCLGAEDQDTGERPEDVPGCIPQAAPMSDQLAAEVEFSNQVFLFIFAVEVVLKIIGFGWTQFSVDRFNLFDLVVVLFGFAEYLSQHLESIPGGGGIISAFRIFRLARVFKAAKYWPSMQSIVRTLIDTLPSLFYLTILLLLLLFIAACTGMQLFGDVGIPLEFRPNFSDFGTAMLTVFQILTGENWNDIMYMSVGHTHYIYVVYFILVFVVGGFVILNLYLAILLSAFDCGEPPEFSLSFLSIVKTKIRAFCSRSARGHLRYGGHDLDLRLDVRSLNPDDLKGHTSNGDSQGNANSSSASYGSQVGGEPSQSSTAAFEELAKFDPTLSNSIAEKEVRRKEEHHQQKTEAIRRALQGKSLCCINKHNRLRLHLAHVVHTAAFDNLILILIIVSTSILALESPKLSERGMESTLFRVLLYADCTFTVLFIFEMLMKIIVYGFITTPSAYLKDPWNCLDFVVVMISTFSLVMFFIARSANLDIAWIRSLRALRALRPLRTIKRAPGMRMAVNTLFDCAPAFLNIGCVAFVIYLAFAIIGVEFFGGKFWKCNDDSVNFVDDCVGEFLYRDDQGVDSFAKRKWINDPMNFDNTGQALLTLFEIAGLELWMLPMYAAMDATGMGEQPKRNTNPVASLYFVIFILFGSFLVMNLFVGAVVDNFNRQTDKVDQGENQDNVSAGAADKYIQHDEGDDNLDKFDEEGATSLFLRQKAAKQSAAQVMTTPGQSAFIDSVNLVFSRKPITRPVPPDPERLCFRLRRWCYNVVMWGPTKLTADGKGKRKVLDGSYFEFFIIMVVLLNTLAMLCYTWHYPSNDTFYDLGNLVKGPPPTVVELQKTAKNVMLDNINNFFTLLFNVELLVKILAWGFKQYLADNWNKIDAFVVFVSDGVYFVEEFFTDDYNSPINPNLVRILRLIKLTRILRVLSRAKEVIFLVETLVYSLPAIANIACLWFIVIFIYAVIGVSLYGDMVVRHEEYLYGMYNEHANFRNFGRALTTLFRMSTGEAWNGIMHDVMHVYPSACIFFSTYILFVSYLLFNLLLAVVLNQFHMEAGSTKKSGSQTKKQGGEPAVGNLGVANASGGDRSMNLTAIGKDHMSAFQEEWVRFDPFASEYIKAVELPLILRRLPPDLCSLDINSNSVDVIRELGQMRINVDHLGRIHFAETFIALIQYSYNRQLHLHHDNFDTKARLALQSSNSRRGSFGNGHGNSFESDDGSLLGLDNDTITLSMASLEGMMGQIVAHYPQLSTQSLTNKPIVEFFAAQRLQKLWHQAKAKRNWAELIARLREIKANKEKNSGEEKLRRTSSWKSRLSLSKKNVATKNEGTVNGEEMHASNSQGGVEECKI